MHESGYAFELIFVDDGSVDATPALLSELAAADSAVKVVLLSRNFGHQTAASAGLRHATGDAVILIDADLQDPPAVMQEMIRKWREGCDVVYGTRRSRAGESFLKLFTARLFYRFLNAMSDIRIPLDAGDFRIMDRRVVDIVNGMPERDRFLRGMVAWIGLKQDTVLYDRNPRFAGVTKYPLRKMLKFAVNGIVSFSNAPLKLATWLGMAVALMAMLGVLGIVYIRLFQDNWVSGWAFISVALFFFSGVQLMCLGLIGEYIGRIYRQNKHRPLYVVDRTINF